MQAHVVEIGTVEHRVKLASGGVRALWYRWRCSCTATGPNTANARSARNGGARHVAAMERGK